MLIGMGLRGLVRVLSRLTFVTGCGVRVVCRLFMLTGTGSYS